MSELEHQQIMDEYVYQCERIAPHNIVRGVRVELDGDRWCCILGDLMTGVYGFGKTPQDACSAFDYMWQYGEPAPETYEEENNDK